MKHAADNGRARPRHREASRAAVRHCKGHNEATECNELEEERQKELAGWRELEQGGPPAQHARRLARENTREADAD